MHVTTEDSKTTDFDEITIIKPSEADLEQLIADVDDITDPSSINKILEYIELINDTDEQFIEILTEKVSNAEITWDLPWYQQFSCLSRSMYDPDSGKEPFQTGPINTDEEQIIDKRWAKFRKRYKLPDGLICLARWKNRKKTKNPNSCPEEKARRFVIAYLAKGLQRTMNQVYVHVLAHHGVTRRGVYTKTEDKIIEICYLHKPNMNGTKLANALGREPRSVYKKMVMLNIGKPAQRKRLKWTLPLATKFIQCLMKYTGLELEELKNRRFDKDVWFELEKDMDQNYIYLQQFWYGYLHVQLFVKCDVKLLKLQKKLFKILRNSSYKVWTDIRWKEVASEFPDGFTPRFLYKVCYRRVKTFKKNYLKTPLKEIAEYSLERIRLRKKLRNRRLKCFILNEVGNLERISYQPDPVRN